MQFDAVSTLLVAALILVGGQFFVKHISWLRTFNIPVPVVGGLLATLVITGLRMSGIQLQFSNEFQAPLMLLFFGSVGLSANLRLIAAGGKALVVFFLLVIGLLFLQNLVGVSICKLLGINHVLGLLAGSITMSGGHGTGAAWAQVFQEQYGVESAFELAMASATFGLVFGSLLGGPVASLLMRSARRKGVDMHVAEAGDGAVSSSPEKRSVTTASVIHVLACMLIGIVAGTWLSSLTAGTWLSLPTFVWSLFTCVVIGNIARFSRLYEINDEANDIVGNTALSIFLALALMNLKLWELADLAMPMLIILAAQVVLVFFYVTQVTFRVMGSNYDAVVLVAGQCGFGMGATPTAVANMQAVTDRYGPSRLAFILVPIVGGFLVDITNAIVIKLFL